VKSFALDGDGNLYLIRYGADRVQMLGPDGGLRKEFAVPEETALLLDLAVDRNGRVLAVDGVHGVVYAAGPSEAALAPITGSLKPYTRFPSRITTDERSRIYLSDRNGCRIAILGQDGSFLASASTRGFKEGLLQYPAQISISGDTLFVADTRNHRFQVFTIVE
jgi:streptogramin lyase